MGCWAGFLAGAPLDGGANGWERGRPDRKDKEARSFLVFAVHTEHEEDAEDEEDKEAARRCLAADETSALPALIKRMIA